MTTKETFQPDYDNDIFIESNGSKLSVSAAGKFIGSFVEDEDAQQSAKDWMNKNNWFPSVWFVSDHGNVSEYSM